MKVDYIALSIPIFFILIGVELIYSVVKKIELYRLNDSLTNISLGIGQQVTGIFMKTALFWGYIYLYENFRFLTVPSTILSWIILFLGVDFFYYWFHRMSHEVNALWAAHIVHHQSEDYNLSVALRQSWFQSAFSWIFYLPLAIMGFEPVMFLTISAFNTLYQFWIHTRTIGKMGPLEWVFNTPSHHRVHHGSDPKYLDKNHAGTLIIWDRLFGTFQKEIEEPHYGITTQLKSWNPLWANFHYWQELWEVASKSTGIKDRFLVFFKPPGWRPVSQGGFQKPKEFDEVNYRKYNAMSRKGFPLYLLIQFTLVLILATAILFLQTRLTQTALILFSSFVLFSLMNFGGLFEMKKWSRSSEILRLVLIPVSSLILLKEPFFYLIFGICITISIASLIYFKLLLSLSVKHPTANRS